MKRIALLTMLSLLGSAVAASAMTIVPISGGDANNVIEIKSKKTNHMSGKHTSGHKGTTGNMKGMDHKGMGGDGAMKGMKGM